MTKSYIDIKGQQVLADSVQLPASGREFRGAWTLEGNQIVVDQAEVTRIKEAEVQREADNATVVSDSDVALAETVVDLVMAAVNGQLAGRTKAQVRVLFRERFIATLRERKGL